MGWPNFVTAVKALIEGESSPGRSKYLSCRWPALPPWYLEGYSDDKRALVHV